MVKMPAGAAAVHNVLMVGSIVFGAMLSGSFAATDAEPAPAQSGESVEQSVCRIIEGAAKSHDLPAAFLTRLIWQESSFRPNVVSPAGAQGIAQFMPGTGKERGLANPFDPEEAIPKAAGFLADLRDRFGNLGLAAAAYNGGPTRVANWQAGRSELPLETRDYVFTITGHSVEDWTGDAAAATVVDSAKRFATPCLETATLVRRASPRQYAVSTLMAPWGVQLSGSFSKAVALASYARARGRYGAVLADLEPMVIGGRLRSRGARPFYRVRAPAATRAAAIQLCDRIHRVGGACIVLRS